MIVKILILVGFVVIAWIYHSRNWDKHNTTKRNDNEVAIYEPQQQQQNSIIHVPISHIERKTVIKNTSTKSTIETVYFREVNSNNENIY